METASLGLFETMTTKRRRIDDPLTARVSVFMPSAIQDCGPSLLRVVLAAILVLVTGYGVRAESVPQYDTVKHLGVASCASSQCHGAAKPYKEGNIRRTEYGEWSRVEVDSVKYKHSKAYEVLLNQQSRTIAKKLGLPNAHEAKVCLDCHTDNVPKERRGEKFQVTDGVGCEACHGGGERWIKSHTEEQATHANNITQGMYPTELPYQRAKLCLSCHYGEANKFATHTIMAAGHPRLRFELDTYTIRQEHYDIDPDYKRRKRFVDSVNVWAIGIATAAAENIAVLHDPNSWSEGLFPEIALFDCHACHHSMKDQRLAPRATTRSLAPGAVRLNDSSLVMLYAIAKAVDGAAAEQLLAAIRRLHEATAKDRSAVIERSRELTVVIQAVQDRFQNIHMDRQAAAAIRKTIIELGASGEFRDYSGAEQAEMALEVLAFALGGEQQLRRDTDKLFDLLRDDAKFEPGKFAKTLGDLPQTLK